MYQCQIPNGEKQKNLRKITNQLKMDLQIVCHFDPYEYVNMSN